ncbi:MAG: phage tail tape measure protein [bacterium]
MGAANTATVKIRMDVDDRGTVKITQLGKVSEKTGEQVDRSFRRGGKSIGSFNDRAADAIKTMMKWIGVMASITVMIAAISQLDKQTFELGKTFERSMATVRGVMRATDEEFIALTESARKMGAMTEWTATQSAEALNYLGMAGFNAEKAIAALPGVLDLATAGGIDLGRASDIATNALTAMGLQVAELGRVNDVFVGTITRTNTNMNMMAESFTYGAPVAKAFGYNIEQLSAMIGVLGNAGVQGSMAGTQLSFAFQQVEDVFKKLGMDGTGKTLIDALEAINQRGMDAQEIMDLFGERAGRAALILKDSIPDYRRLVDELKNAKGEAKTLADVMRNTTDGAVKELGSAFDDIMLQAFTDETGTLVDTIKNLTRYIRENKEELSGFIANTMDATAGLIRMATTIADKVTPVLGVLNASFHGIKTMFQWLGLKSAGIDTGILNTNDINSNAYETAMASNISNTKQDIEDIRKKIEETQNRLAELKKFGTESSINEVRGTLAYLWRELDSAIQKEKDLIANLDKYQKTKKSDQQYETDKKALEALVGHYEKVAASTEKVKDATVDAEAAMTALEATANQFIVKGPILGDDYGDLKSAYEVGLRAVVDMSNAAADAAETASAAYADMVEEARRAARAFDEAAGQRFADSFVAGMRDGMAGVWDTLRDKMTGVVAHSIGQSIGAAIENEVSHALYTAFEGVSMAMSEIIGGIAGGLAGGLAGVGAGMLINGLVNGNGEGNTERHLKMMLSRLEQIEKNTKENVQALKAQLSATTNANPWGASIAGVLNTYQQKISDIRADLGTRPNDITLGPEWDKLYSVARGAMTAAREEFITQIQIFKADVQKDIRDLWQSVLDTNITSYDKSRRDIDQSWKDVFMGAIATTSNAAGELISEVDPIYTQLFDSVDTTLDDIFSAISQNITSLKLEYNNIQTNQPGKYDSFDTFLKTAYDGTYSYLIGFADMVNKYIGSVYTNNIQYQKQQAAITSDINVYMQDLRGDLTPLDKALMDVNKRFDDWTAALKDAGLAEADLSVQREEAIKITKELYTETGKLTDEMRAQALTLGKTLTGSILQNTMSADDYSRWSINEQYADYVSQAMALGEGFSYLIHRAEVWRDTALDALDSQIAATETQKKAADYQSEASAWRSVADSIQSVIDQYTFGIENPVTAQARMDLIQAELATINENDAADISRGQDLWRQYMQLAQEVYQRPSDDYLDIYTEAMDNLERLQDLALGKETEMLGLARAQNSILTEIEKNTRTLSDAADQPQSKTYADLPNMQIMYDYAGYFDNTVAGFVMDFADGTLTRLAGDLARYESATEDFVFSRLDSLYDVAKQSENIRRAWEDKYGVDISQYTLPGFATGLDYVPEDMPVRVHAREAILNEQDADRWRRDKASGGNVIQIGDIYITESKSARETAQEVRRELEGLLRSRLGRKIVKTAVNG